MATKADLDIMDQQLKPHIDKLLNIMGKDRPLPPPKPAADGLVFRPEMALRPPVGFELDPKNLTVKRIIGQGAYGTVYRGVYQGGDVAVKILECEDGNRRAYLEKEFLQEVSVWYELDHPNIAKLIGATRSLSYVNIRSKHGIRLPNKDAYCIVVEYLPGGTLKSYLSKNRSKKLPQSVALQLAIDIAKGLSYLHSKKIVHRDVKTENLLLDKGGRVKLVDFGVSRPEAMNQNEMTAQTGTVGYMAPEVFDGNSYDHKCDVYSFGICLWEIYSCAFPYPDLNPNKPYSSAIYKSRRPDIPRSCPTAITTVMKECWDSNPRNRPEMKKVVEMLEAIKETEDRAATSRQQHSSLGCFCFPASKSILEPS